MFPHHQVPFYKDPKIEQIQLTFPPHRFRLILDLWGNLVNTDTKWNITGSLIKKVDLKESDIFCTVGRTLYIPVRLVWLIESSVWNLFDCQVPDIPGCNGHLWGDGRERELFKEVWNVWGVRHLPRERQEEQSNWRLLRAWGEVYLLAAIQARLENIFNQK